MKRIEMVELIAKEFSLDLEKAYSILNRIEELGMLPPERLNEKYDIKEAVKYDEHLFLEYPEEKYIRTWEE